MSSQGIGLHDNATSLQVTLTIEREPTPSGTYFWAQQFRPAGPVDHGGYFGLQTGGVIGNQIVGKMLIFSIWNAVEAQAGPSATAQPFGGEGIGYSVRRAFAWQENVPYTFRMQRLDYPPVVGAGHLSARHAAHLPRTHPRNAADRAGALDASVHRILH